MGSGVTSVISWLKRLAAAVVGPAVFLSLAAYFLWSATQGERGLQAYGIARGELVVAKDRLAAAEEEVRIWERRVAGMRPSSKMDPDAVDERARATLNLADPNEIIILYGSGKRLY